jgi:hypothetical protein
MTASKIFSFLFALLPFSIGAHDLLDPLSQQINPPSRAAERDNAKLNFLSQQADRFSVKSSMVQDVYSSIYHTAYTWKNNLTLKICFWNGTPEQQHAVMQLASVWTDAVPALKFDYIQNGDVRKCDFDALHDPNLISDIRIAMEENTPDNFYHSDMVGSKSGDWAYYGKSVAQDPAYPVTMNLVGAMRLRKDGDELNYKFNVRHEFGHALSLVHEHQRALCAGWFDINQIAKDNPPWTKEQAQAQVGAIDESSNSYTFVGAYDRNSIMQYNFASNWYIDSPGKTNPCRRDHQVTDLSDLDKIVVAAIYQPELNETPERKAIIANAGQAARAVTRQAARAVTRSFAGTQFAADQAASVSKALAGFSIESRRTDQLTIQVYPHKADEKTVLQALANLGYPIRDQNGEKLISISGKVTAGLESDPTNTLIYTKDVSDQDVRYIALSLMQAGIALKSVQPYVKHQRNGYTERWSLVQVGADVTNRRRAALTQEDILGKPFPLYGPQRPK